LKPNANIYVSFAIGYVYSFVAAGVFYWLFNKLSPHTESIMDHPETGEEIIAAQDAKNVEAARADRAVRNPSIVSQMFTV
jgi:NCS1 family nucleobase:cation symporter-1